MPKTVTLVVPCYNEAHRLDTGAFLHLLDRRAGLDLVFVDDGSTDGTAEVLEELRGRSDGRVAILRQPTNRGKSEAVRTGLRAALAGSAEVVGYADADLATPPDELVGMAESMDDAPVAVLLGSRVRLLGRRIERRAARHYLGRIFATVASIALGIQVYDTQCGAKLFLRTDALAGAIARPFRSRWIFDVELIERLLDGAGGAPPVPTAAMREHPLREWRDVRGSSLRAAAMWKAGLQLLALAARRAFRVFSRKRPPARPGMPGSPPGVAGGHGGAR